MLDRQAISFETSDGVNISGHWYPAILERGPRPALVLLHGGNRTKERWDETGFVEALANENYHYLAIDLRGRGESESGDLEALRRDPTLARFDVAAALDWVRSQPGVAVERIALVGSSYGANLASAGLLEWGLSARTLVCFSATAVTYRFLEHTPGARRTPIRSGLFLACDAEAPRYAAPDTAARLAADTAGRRSVLVYPGPFHALAMFEMVADCRDAVIAWLRSELCRPVPG